MTARARATDPATSHEGARAVTYRAGSQKARLLAVYEQSYPVGLTDEEAAQRAGLYRFRSCCWWKRCSELRQDGKIEPIAGFTRMGSAGARRMVSRWVPNSGPVQPTLF